MRDVDHSPSGDLDWHGKHGACVGEFEQAGYEAEMSREEGGDSLAQWHSEPGWGAPEAGQGLLLTCPGFCAAGEGKHHAAFNSALFYD